MLNRLRKFIETRTGIVVSRKRSPYNLPLYECLYSPERLKEKPFYNIGSETFWHPYWTNLDYVSEWYSGTQRDFVPYDLMALGPLPIKDGTAEIIYTSHTIEHIKEPGVRNLFSNAYRALKPGGIIRVTTGPDAETEFRAMMRGDADWFYWDNWYKEPGSYEGLWTVPPGSVALEERWLDHVAAPLAPHSKAPSPIKYHAAEIRKIIAEKGFEGSLDFFTGQCPYDPKNPSSHISWWTHDKVMRYLREAGFTNVYRSGRGQSASVLMRGSEQFDSTHPQMSLYVEAIR